MLGADYLLDVRDATLFVPTTEALKAGIDDLAFFLSDLQLDWDAPVPLATGDAFSIEKLLDQVKLHLAADGALTVAQLPAGLTLSSNDPANPLTIQSSQ
jgi:hypothetical protein